MFGVRTPRTEDSAWLLRIVALRPSRSANQGSDHSRLGAERLYGEVRMGGVQDHFFRPAGLEHSSRGAQAPIRKVPAIMDTSARN